MKLEPSCTTGDSGLIKPHGSRSSPEKEQEKIQKWTELFWYKMVISYQGSPSIFTKISLKDREKELHNEKLIWPEFSASICKEIYKL